MKKIIPLALIISVLAFSSFAHARDIRSATCDIGWRLVIKKGTDKCVTRNFWGKQEGNYTIPSGTISFGINPKLKGWRLIRDHKNKHDYWVK